MPVPKQTRQEGTIQVTLQGRLTGTLRTVTHRRGRVHADLFFNLPLLHWVGSQVSLPSPGLSPQGCQLLCGWVYRDPLPFWEEDSTGENVQALL